MWVLVLSLFFVSNASVGRAHDTIKIQKGIIDFLLFPLTATIYILSLPFEKYTAHSNSSLEKEDVSSNVALQSENRASEFDLENEYPPIIFDLDSEIPPLSVEQ